MSRIKLNDSSKGIVLKMCDGNPGSLSALMTILKDYEEIDPEASMGGLGLILKLDDLGIYGTDIYILYNDKCDRDLRKLAVLFRAHQFGFVITEKIIEMSKDQTRKIDLTETEWKGIDEKVCEKLKRFKKNKQGENRENRRKPRI